MKRKPNGQTKRLVWKRDDYTCTYCDCQCNKPPTNRSTIPHDPAMATVDHIHPVHAGGGAKPRNLITACLYCNGERGKQSLDAYLRFLKSRGVDVITIKQRIVDVQRRL